MTAPTETDARAELERMTAADSEPKLDHAHITALVALAGRLQANGTIAYVDLNAAAAEGWRRKAGIAAADFNVKAGTSSVDQHQRFQACMRMYEVYAAAAKADLDARTDVITGPDGGGYWMADPNGPTGDKFDIYKLVGNL